MVRESRPNHLGPSGTAWKRACNYPLPEIRRYPASGHDLSVVGGLLAARGFEPSDDMVQVVLNSLSETRTKVQIRQLDGSYVEITAAQAIAALGHDL
jgi:hypothetical protein